MTKREEPAWTEQCRDGRACARPANYAEITEVLHRRKVTKRGASEPLPPPSAEKDMRTAAFIPDDAGDICDYCLAAKYGLEGRHDACDGEGLGPQYVELEAALKALRRAEREGGASDVGRVFEQVAALALREGDVLSNDWRGVETRRVVRVSHDADREKVHFVYRKTDAEGRESDEEQPSSLREGALVLRLVRPAAAAAGAGAGNKGESGEGGAAGADRR